MLTLTWLDTLIIIGFLVSVVVVGSWAAKRAGQNTEAFFLSGRNMPWWLLGVSMVACTFSCDTPNLITEIVRLNGVAGNWVWWAFLLTGISPGLSLVCAMAGVAVYATLGGLTGSIWADFYQFAVAMTGAIFAAVYAIDSGMAEGVHSLRELIVHPAVSGKLALLPPLTGDLSTLMTVLILPLAVQWWNVWYPGAEPGGGGFIA
ncbi:MAG: hypothetical protein PF904_11945 [Kiritimatiellae bacterium]|jgi:SSS family solute:Na+ symporter|nr:hypothetical protein [Kiritimatiellia bacterium]